MLNLYIQKSFNSTLSDWFTHNDSCLTEFFFVKAGHLSSPLVIAAGKGHTEIVEKLISAGAVSNYQNKV